MSVVKEKVVRKTMAKYSCGHEQEILLTGSKKVKEKKLARKLAKSKCRECYKV